MTRTSRAVSIAAGALALLAWTAPRDAHAFCGFYVGGAGSELYNNASQVVLMREGTRTVLSMQNNYQGPTEDFAMVVPVPVVLAKANVKTLPAEIFRRVDKIDAPRLVEYWERDPCYVERQFDEDEGKMDKGAAKATGARANLGVKVEAKFAVGEYDIVILSANDSTGLETWLRQNKYAIPKGAATYLNPYVQSGSKFFVAKVNAKKVKFNAQGMAELSPLRVHYDSTKFNLPIRLGMMNSKGKQDLIVHIVARGQRYEVANYKNVTIPTNLEVVDGVRKRFGEFYASLFDKTLEKNPNSVVTEYAWAARSCDPCPERPLSASELATLGADVLTATPATPGGMSSFVLTRLHARYSKGGLKDDLVFKKASPIVGGRERMRGNKLEYGAAPASVNNFQGRYIIRHKWQGKIACNKPHRGIWGGPWPTVKRTNKPVPAMDLAFAPRGKVVLASMVEQDVPELAVKSTAPRPTTGAGAGAPATSGATSHGMGSRPATPYKAKPVKAYPRKPLDTKRSRMHCSCTSSTPESSAGTMLLGLAVALVLRRRQRHA